jgi:hypothetical protein
VGAGCVDFGLTGRRAGSGARRGVGVGVGLGTTSAKLEADASGSAIISRPQCLMFRFADSARSRIKFSPA